MAKGPGEAALLGVLQVCRGVAAWNAVEASRPTNIMISYSQNIYDTS